MLYAGLGLSRRRLDVCLLDEPGGLLAENRVPPDSDGLRGLAGRLAGWPVRAVIESMNGARFATRSRSTAPRCWSPTRRRSTAWRRWHARPTGSTRAWSRRSHATLITFGHPCPVSDLFGLAGRELLDRLEIPIRGVATSTSAWG
jgi:transposase